MSKSNYDQENITKSTEIQSSNDKWKDIGIYGIRNKITNKWYIGQSSKSISRRWRHYKFLDCKPQTKLYRTLLKYGIDSFEFFILENCPPDEKILDEREDYWIQHYNSVLNGYNCRGGGWRGFSPTEETLEKVRHSCRSYWTEEIRSKKAEITRNLWKDGKYRDRVLKHRPKKEPPPKKTPEEFSNIMKVASRRRWEKVRLNQSLTSSEL